MFFCVEADGVERPVDEKPAFAVLRRRLDVFGLYVVSQSQRPFLRNQTAVRLATFCLRQLQIFGVTLRFTAVLPTIFPPIGQNALARFRNEYQSFVACAGICS